MIYNVRNVSASRPKYSTWILTTVQRLGGNVYNVFMSLYSINCLLKNVFVYNICLYIYIIELKLKINSLKNIIYITAVYNMFLTWSLYWCRPRGLVEMSSKSLFPRASHPSIYVYDDDPLELIQTWMNFLHRILCAAAHPVDIITIYYDDGWILWVVL